MNIEKQISVFLLQEIVLWWYRKCQSQNIPENMYRPVTIISNNFLILVRIILLNNKFFQTETQLKSRTLSFYSSHSYQGEKQLHYLAPKKIEKTSPPGFEKNMENSLSPIIINHLFKILRQFAVTVCRNGTLNHWNLLECYLHQIRLKGLSKKLIEFNFLFHCQVEKNFIKSET